MRPFCPSGRGSSAFLVVTGSFSQSELCTDEEVGVVSQLWRGGGGFWRRRAWG